MWRLILAVILALAAPAFPTDGEPELADVLTRAGRYIEGYYRDFSNVLAVETYRQIHRPPFEKVELRTLESDVLLVRPEGEARYRMFRDVAKVNGHAVRDREERLKQTFLDSPATLAVIAEESARYNIGPVRRDFNVPLTALDFLSAGNQPSFRFEKAGETTLAGQAVWVIRFTEVGHPTFILYNSTDMAATGTFWIAPADGRVWASELVLTPANPPLYAAIRVAFRLDPALGLLVPAEMKERYFWDPGRIEAARAGENPMPDVEGRATYDHFRKFTVETEENIAPPSER